MAAQCTTDCFGESCESITNIEGVCYASDVDSLESCELYGSDNSVVTEWYQGNLCVLDGVSSSDSCSLVLISLSLLSCFSFFVSVLLGVFFLFFTFCFLFFTFLIFLSDFTFLIQNKQQFPSRSVWATCQQNEVGECSGEPFPQRYLGCYVSRWHVCGTQEECEQSGSCSDRIWTTIVRSEEYPVDVQV